MEKLSTKNLKGVFDYYGEEQLIRDKIKKILTTNFERYGYESLESSILYNYDLLAYKYDNDAEILNEIYKLSDQGGRNLALRYDLTMPFCKVIAENKTLRLPYKRYEIGNVFRNGPVKPGRNREFTQCDVDVVGLDGRYIEVELFSLVVDIFNQLGIDINIKWNNRKLMSGLLYYLGIDEDIIEKCISILDKMEKITKKELEIEFNKLKIDNATVDKLLNIFSLSIKEYKEMFSNSNNVLINEGLQEIDELQNYINALGLENNTTFCPTLARGLSIYTGTVYEFFDKQERLKCSLGSGGRYNKIITEFINDGKEYPACGLSFGLEPIYTILKEEKLTTNIDLYIIPIDTKIECLKLARYLRNEGMKIEIELTDRKVKKCFEYAAKKNIKYVAVIGEEEIKDNIITIKNMETGTQEKIPKEEIQKKIM